MALDPIQLPQRYENTPVECDAALGLYMRAWNHLEMAVSCLFGKLVDTDIVTSNIIFNAGIDQHTLRSIMDALGQQRLQGSDYQSLSRLLGRMKDAATVRNRLIHGTWMLWIIMSDKPREAKTAEWVRFYLPTDPEIYGKIVGKRANQKLLAKHRFTLKRIATISQDVQKLARDVEAFEKKVSLQPVRTPQPVF